MLNYESFNDKYYSLKQESNPNSLFASFKVFQTQVRGRGALGRRPPYPIIKSDPSCSEVFFNMNKSDVLVGLSYYTLGFFMTLYATKGIPSLAFRFSLTRTYMVFWSGIAIFAAMTCSFFRLRGILDNGLRWKHKEMIDTKYDFTSDFERNTIFKYFRNRLD
jgi:hypothetical protein